MSLGLAVAEPASMRSRRLIARVPGPADLSTVYDWVNDPLISYRWRARGVQLSPAQFEESISTTSAHFIGYHLRSDQPVAYGAVFALDLRAQHAQVGLLSSPKFLGTGIAIELGALLVRYAFDVYPLRKIYLEMASFNRGPLEQILSSYATLEAEIPEHVYWNGALHTTLMFSLSRDVWFGAAQDRWLPFLGPSRGAPPSTSDRSDAPWNGGTR